MTSPDLLRLAQELNRSGEPYAMVTVVRAAPPTSAFVGGQAVVFGDGTVHGERFYSCCDGCKVEFERNPTRYAAVQANAQRVAVLEGTS